MKRFYLKFRIALLTLALGLSSVNFVRWLDNYRNEPRVELPQVENGSPIFILARKRGEHRMLRKGLSCGNPFELDFGCPNLCDAPEYKNKHKKKSCIVE